MQWSHRIQPIPDLAYGPMPQQRLDLVLQVRRVGEPVFYEQLDSPSPLLVWIHGGGWIQGDKATQWNHIIPFLQRGWHVANVNYRQGPGTAPFAVEDCLLALGWLEANAETLRLKYDRIVVAGASAGGHLALTTGLMSSDEKRPELALSQHPVSAIVNWYGITDFAAVTAWLDETRSAGNYARIWAGPRDIGELSAEYSPLAMIHDAAPPILTIHGDSDTVVPPTQATALHEALDRASLRGEHLSLVGGNHGGFTDAQYEQAFGTIFAFLSD